MALGVVSLLDGPHFERVEQLWQELQEQFGVGDPEAKAMPHFSYHVAEGYEVEPVVEFLAEVGAAQRPFTITATGLALFPGSEPVLYIPIVRSQELTDLHARLWSRLNTLAEQSFAYYAPQNWFPHITLGHTDVTLEKWLPAIAWLHQQQINWTISINNFYVLANEAPGHVTKAHVMFGRV
jgi:2'-5' RNA ligase